MKMVGVYITCDDALCTNCAHRRFVFVSGESEGDPWDILVRNWRKAGGFESWDEPAVIFDDTESDSPTHCKKCGELIPHDLTPDGYRLVEDSTWAQIREFVEHRATPNAHSVKVVHAWLEQYGDWGDMNAIVIALHKALYEAMDLADYFLDEDEDPCLDNACGGPPDCQCMCHDDEYDHSRAKEDRRNAYLDEWEREELGQ